jgi:tetratricopeptide (TPR) repeat protein
MLDNEYRLSPYRKHAFAFLTLFTIIVATYSNSFHASWHLDDGPNITENRQVRIRSLSWAEIKKTLFSTPSSTNIEFFRPLSRLSLAFNYYISGDEVFGYHIANVAIHILASIFLYLFIYNLLGLPLIAVRYEHDAYSIALMATVLWAIHPIQTQAVTYIVQRMTSMAGMFYVMSMYFYVKAQGKKKAFRRSFYLILCAIAGLLSIGAKENAILLPVSLFLFRLILVQGVTRRSLKNTLVTFSATYLLPICACLFYLFFFSDFIERVFGIYDSRVFTLWERLITEPRIILLYISLLLYPVSSRFSVDHDIVISTSLLDPPVTVLSIVLVLGITTAASLIAKREPLCSFSILFFFLNHTVESTILPLELVFEHRNYVPSMFIFLPVVILGIKALQLFSEYRLKVVVFATFSFLLGTLGLSTYLRNGAWKDERTLWGDCLEKYPFSFRAHHNLGRYFSLRGEEHKALIHYYQALSGKDIHGKKKKGITFFNIGLIAHNAGDYQKAFSLYKKALELDPCCPGAHNNLAALLLMNDPNDLEEPVRVLENGLSCRNETETPLALSNLGILLMKKGKSAEALDMLRKAAEMDPKNTLTLQRLGYVLKEMGQFSEAASLFERALAFAPADASTYFLLGETHLRQGLTEKVRSTLRRLLDAVSMDSIYAYLSESAKSKGPTDIIPDVALIIPFLEETSRERGAEITVEIHSPKERSH